jgi:hypothetical protein
VGHVRGIDERRNSSKTFSWSKIIERILKMVGGGGGEGMAGFTWVRRGRSNELLGIT